MAMAALCSASFGVGIFDSTLPPIPAPPHAAYVILSRPPRPNPRERIRASSSVEGRAPSLEQGSSCRIPHQLTSPAAPNGWVQKAIHGTTGL